MWSCMKASSVAKRTITECGEGIGKTPDLAKKCWPDAGHIIHNEHFPMTSVIISPDGSWNCVSTTEVLLLKRSLVARPTCQSVWTRCPSLYACIIHLFVRSKETKIKIECESEVINKRRVCGFLCTYDASTALDRRWVVGANHPWDVKCFLLCRACAALVVLFCVPFSLLAAAASPTFSHDQPQQPNGRYYDSNKLHSKGHHINTIW